MTTLLYDVCAIGNALVDVISNADDAFLQNHGITKAAMTLIDTARADELYELIATGVEMSGGSAGNTVAGVASLGGTPAYLGKVKSDKLGAIFRHDMRAQGVHFATTPATDGTPTGRCIIFVTPDAQRSMSTYLGAAVEFSERDIDVQVIQNAQVTYMEGYLFDPPEAKKAFRLAAHIAKEAGRKVSLTLSDSFCVERHRTEFLDLVKNDIDILFANEHELCALYQTHNLDEAIAAVRTQTEIAVTTQSAKGAIITAGTATHHIDAASVSQVVDTTGAGDLYASGFLFGLTHGKTLAEAGRIGAIAAAEVISHYGPRPQIKLSNLI